MPGSPHWTHATTFRSSTTPSMLFPSQRPPLVETIISTEQHFFSTPSIAHWLSHKGRHTNHTTLRLFRRSKICETPTSDPLVWAPQCNPGWRSCPLAHRLLPGDPVEPGGGWYLSRIPPNNQAGGLIPFSSEDCLYLNVHVPVTQDDKPLPVMVIIIFQSLISLNGKIPQISYARLFSI